MSVFDRFDPLTKEYLTELRSKGILHFEEDPVVDVFKMRENVYSIYSRSPGAGGDAFLPNLSGLGLCRTVPCLATAPKVLFLLRPGVCLPPKPAEPLLFLPRSFLGFGAFEFFPVGFSLSTVFPPCGFGELPPDFGGGLVPKRLVFIFVPPELLSNSDVFGILFLPVELKVL